MCERGEETHSVAQSVSRSKKTFFKLHLPFRLFVPILYVFCAICFFLSFYEIYQRNALAQNISTVILHNHPATLTELKALLGNHIRYIQKSEQYNATLEAYVIVLSPRVWLNLWVDIQPDGESINNISLVYANSDKMSLNNYQKELPEDIPWYSWLLVFSGAVIPSWFWLQMTNEPRFEAFQPTVRTFLVTISPIVTIVILLPLVFFLPASLLLVLPVLLG